MEGWVDLVDLIARRPGVEPATFRSRVWRRTAAPPRQLNWQTDAWCSHGAVCNVMNCLICTQRVVRSKTIESSSPPTKTRESNQQRSTVTNHNNNNEFNNQQHSNITNEKARLYDEIQHSDSSGTLAIHIHDLISFCTSYTYSWVIYYVHINTYSWLISFCVCSFHLNSQVLFCSFNVMYRPGHQLWIALDIVVSRNVLASNLADTY